MLTDIRFALRSLSRARGFFLLAVSTLGLGIAATTTIFSMFYQVLLRSLPLPDPQELVIAHFEGRGLSGWTTSDNSETVFSVPVYNAFRDRAQSFKGITARGGRSEAVTVGQDEEHENVDVVAGNFFEVLGVHAALGRLLDPSDDTTKAGNPVAVLSYDCWVKRFGSNPGALNQKILVNRQPFVIVGVAAEGFRGIKSGTDPQVYVPISMITTFASAGPHYDQSDTHWLTVIGRLKTSRERAAAELQPIFSAQVEDYLDTHNVKNAAARKRVEALRIQLVPASQGLNQLERQWHKPLNVLLGMVSLLLVIGCANLANLLVARGVNRAPELTVRMALGAGRARLVRLLMAESLIIALCGTLLGLMLSPALARGLIALLPHASEAGWLSADLSVPVLIFSALIMIAATLISGLVPALQATRERRSALGERTQTSRIHAGTRRVLVVAELAFSLVLLAAAGLFGRSLFNLMTLSPGFRVDHLLTFTVDPSRAGYTPERGIAFFKELTARIAAMPGVQLVACSSSRPLTGSESSSNVSVEGYQAGPDENMDSDENLISPGYFRTLGTPLISGREFEDGDSAKAPKVAIVNQAFVRRFFKGADPLGKHMAPGDGTPNIQIVGVVADAKNRNLREIPKPTFYVPYSQDLANAPRMADLSMYVRADSGFAALPGAVRATVGSLDPALRVFNMETMGERVTEAALTDRLISALSVAFGVLAILITAVGLYSVISYLAGRRTAEIGIRMALGADRGDILWLVLREVLGMIAAGCLLGIVGATAAGRAIESQMQLFGVHGVDPLVIALAAIVLGITAIAAGYFPALVAARTQPVTALRHS